MRHQKHAQAVGEERVTVVSSGRCSSIPNIQFSTCVLPVLQQMLGQKMSPLPYFVVY